MINYCSDCGSKGSKAIPEADDRLRFICDGCGKIHYENPRIIAACLATWDEKILLCSRAIEPRKGFWTIPGGFLENNETVEEGARRETWEEARAKVELTNVHCVYSIPHISQVFVVFLGKVIDGVFAPGPESVDVRLLSVEDIPWEELAFSAIRFALEKYVARLDTGSNEAYYGSFIKKDENQGLY